MRISPFMSLVISMLLHVIVVAIALFELPFLFGKEEEVQEDVMVIEVLPIAEQPNIPVEAPPPPPPAEEEKAESLPEDTPEEEVIDEEVLQAVIEAEAKAAKEAEEKAKAEAEAKRKAEEEAAQKAYEEKEKARREEEKRRQEEITKQFEEMIQNAIDTPTVHKSPAAEEVVPEKEPAPSVDASDSIYDAEKALSMTEKERISQYIQGYWKVVPGMNEMDTVQVILRFSLRVSGELASEVTVHDQLRYNNDPSYRAVADSAIRAVYASMPIPDLPPEKYSQWRDLEFVFTRDGPD